MPTAPQILADIGGTNTRVALARDGIVDRASIQRFANTAHESLPAILHTYLGAAGLTGCSAACLAVAGPVRDGVAEMTNLSWRITEADIRAATRADRVAILNDLQAQGQALDRLRSENLRTILPGTARAGARLVIGCGTGFNAAPVQRTSSGLMVPPSECGHITLPVRTEVELRLCRFLERDHGFAGVEDVLSGRGLERLHAFITADAGREDRLPAAEIMRLIASGDAAAQRSCDLFTTLFGRIAGDFALTHLAFGGLYLIGGVTRAFAPYLSRHGFNAAFRDKGRFSEFMDQFRVVVVEDDYAALEGCAEYLAPAKAR